MNNVPNREWKISYLRIHFLCHRKGISYIAIGDELHHRCPDTKHMRANCRDAVHSMLNLVPLNHDFHIANKSFMGQKQERLERIQKFLSSTGKHGYIGEHWTDKYYMPAPGQKSIHWMMRDFINGKRKKIWD